MPAFHRILLLVTVAVALVEARKSLRAKRSLLELAGAIECSTGQSPLRYVMYGCYCGLGGRGWPRDAADWCCHKHDCCYGEAEQERCSTKTVQYKWWCDDKEPECEDVKDKCQKKLCDCDRDLAKCLGKASFRKKFVLWPDFMCGFGEPSCKLYKPDQRPVRLPFYTRPSPAKKTPFWSFS